MKRKLATQFVSCGLACALAVAAMSGCADRKVMMEQEDTRIVRVWTGDRHSKDVMEQIVQRFNETTGKEKGITIEYSVYSDDVGNIVEMAHASGQAPEIHGGVSNLMEYVAKGWIVPLDSMPGGPELIEQFRVRELDPAAYLTRTETYQLPVMVTTVKWIYNRDLFKKAGIVDENGQAKAPKTWAEVVEYARLITAAGGGNEYGLVFPMKLAGFFRDQVQMFIPSAGTNEWNSKTGKFDYTIYKSAFTEYLLKAKADKSFVPGPEGMDNDTARALFADGKVGMKSAGSYDVAVLNDQFKATCDWAVTDLPVLDPNKRYKEQLWLGKGMTLTSEATREPEKVMEVYKLLCSDETRITLYEKGKTIPHDNRIIELAKKPENIRGWEEFANLSNTFFAYPRPWYTVDTGDSEEQVYQKIWAGTLGVDEGLKSYSDRANASVERDVAAGKYKVESYIDPHYDISVNQ